MRIPAGFLAAAMLAAAADVVTPEEKKDGFKPLFNHKNLKEWKGDPLLWRVVNKMIVGSTDDVQIPRNTFLIHKKEWSSFHLKFQVKLRNGNSGVQFRSEELPEFVVRGLQADLAEGAWWGSIYDEGGKRGVIANGWTGKAEKAVKPGGWNDYEIIAQGDSVTLKVNGLVTAAIRDNSRLSGVIALQLHRGPGMRVYFRNLRIKAL